MTRKPPECWTSQEFDFIDNLCAHINYYKNYTVCYSTGTKVISICDENAQRISKTIEESTPYMPPRFFVCFSDIVYHYPAEVEVNSSSSDAGRLAETIEKMQQVLSSANAVFAPHPAGNSYYKHTIKIEKEDKEMNTSNIINFDFGPVQSDCIRLSTYGLAVKNKEGVYVSYDPASKSLVNVDIFSFEGKKFLYKIPAAIDDIKVGDIVLHNKAVHYVIGLGDDFKTLKVIDPMAGERKEILLTKSPFGFDFAIKVVNLLAGAFDSAATSTNPFGNMWMMALMSDSGTDNLLPLMMMQNGGNIDPMMMYCLMSKGDNDMMLPLLLMSQNKPHTCKCGGCCSDKEDND